MGKKELLLCSILNANKGERFKVIESELKNIDEIKSIYKDLGGCSDKIPLNIGNFDIKINNKYIELDEQLHFNRYRLLTLKSKIYLMCDFFNLDYYKLLCKDYEKECLKSGGYGGKWKNNSTEKLFSKSSSYKDLNGNGSSRWKQRAFYDFIKDLYAYENNLILRRISIWEEISPNLLIRDILDNEIKEKYPKLREYILNKLNKKIDKNESQRI